jgi:uncharacterized phage-associated protein
MCGVPLLTGVTTGDHAAGDYVALTITIIVRPGGHVRATVRQDRSPWWREWREWRMIFAMSAMIVRHLAEQSGVVWRDVRHDRSPWWREWREWRMIFAMSATWQNKVARRSP